MPTSSSSSTSSTVADAGTAFIVSCLLDTNGSAFQLRSLRMTETLGQPFQIELDLQSTQFDLDIGRLVGQPMSITMLYHKGAATRYFHGRVVRIGLARASSRFAIYHAVLRPWLWLLNYNNDCRIFQNKTIPEIIKTSICANRGFNDISDKLDASMYSTPREYVVQYRESDFAFISRLMEDEGIFYYFTHTDSAHTMVLCDSISGAVEVTDSTTIPYDPGAQESYVRDAIADWHDVKELETAQYLLTNFDFAKPATNLLGKSANTPAGLSGVSVFDYPGVHLTVTDGDRYAKIRLEELQVPHETYSGYGNPRGLGAGNKFTLEEHPRDVLNQEYLIIGATTEIASTVRELADLGDDTGYRFKTDFTAIPTSRVFRPARITPKPLIPGPQTAIVVGPAGDEIHTDKYGRVKLKFHWDRESKSDETSSCFVRVSSALAGKNWGHVFLPRIGQEVIVEFLEGDPDRPIITGRVYNGDLMPPYALPDHMTKSTMKSRSTKGGTTETFNELRFEDLKDSEEIYFHAEKDFNRVVENNDSLKVGFEKKDKGDQTITIYHDRKLTVGNNETIKIGDGDGKQDGNQVLTIYKDRTTELTTGNDTLTVKAGNSTTTVNKDRTITVETGNDSLKISAGTQTTEAAQSITLKVGGNKIVIDQQGITLTGTKISITGQASAEMTSPMTKVTASGILTLQGSLTKIN